MKFSDCGTCMVWAALFRAVPEGIRWGLWNRFSLTQLSLCYVMDTDGHFPPSWRKPVWFIVNLRHSGERGDAPRTCSCLPQLLPLSQRWYFVRVLCKVSVLVAVSFFTYTNAGGFFCGCFSPAFEKHDRSSETFPQGQPLPHLPHPLNMGQKGCSDCSH